ncbi:MAG: NAD(P)-dependent dehydrogenase (short-subunit alcohol dehydrogenase family) [Hyphomicrobiaceae bacterium]
MLNFEDHVAFITGGGTGIGLACASEIIAGGGRVVLAGRREDVLKEAAATLGERATYVVCDVNDDASVEQAVAQVIAQQGSLSLAVNAAGMGMAGSVLGTSVELFQMVMETNLTGCFRAMQAEARAMRAAGKGGSIVNISSIAGALTHRWMTAYCVSKAGVNMLTQCAADDLGEFGIRVNAVMPGIVDTELAGPLVDSEHAQREYKSLMPISRVGEPADIGKMVAFLLSEESSWITGQVIGVDGGHTIRKGPDLRPLFRGLLPDEPEE